MSEHFAEGLSLLADLLDEARRMTSQGSSDRLVLFARRLAKLLDAQDAAGSTLPADPVTTPPSRGGSGEGPVGARGAEPRPWSRMTDEFIYRLAAAQPNPELARAIGELLEWREWSRRNP